MDYPNLFILWDCEASDATQVFAHKYDAATLSIQLPQAFEDVLAARPACELWASSTLQPIKLFYEHHVATHDLAVIFVNTACSSVLEGESEEQQEVAMAKHYMRARDCSEEQAHEDVANLSADDRAELQDACCKPLPWHNAVERGELARQTFKEVLNFYDINVFVDLSKDEIVAELDKIKYQAGTFDDERGENETLAVAIVWIGHKIMADYPPHSELMEEKEFEMPPTSEGTEDFTGNFEVTTQGEILCINEHVGRMAQFPSVHVIQISDSQPKDQAKLRAHHISSEDDEFDEMLFERRPGRERTTFCYDADIEALSKALSKLGRVIQFPKHAERLTPCMKWLTVRRMEQITFDTRKSPEKEAARQSYAALPQQQAKPELLFAED